MSDQEQPRLPPKRYVTRREMLAQATARQQMLQMALDEAKPPEATPAPSICHFEPLWAVCVADCPLEPGAQCARSVLRDRAIFEARLQVLFRRAGL